MLTNDTHPLTICVTALNLNLIQRFCRPMSTNQELEACSESNIYRSINMFSDTPVNFTQFQNICQIVYFVCVFEKVCLHRRHMEVIVLFLVSQTKGDIPVVLLLWMCCIQL